MNHFCSPFFTCLILAFLFTTKAEAQTAPVFSNFYANPYQFNPAFVSHNGYTEANVMYRKQWLNISNAPTTLAFNVQAPVGRNVSLGLNIISDKTILLSTNYAMTTFGYRIRFTKTHHLNFGLSAGVGFNNYDFESVNESGDPALNYQNNTFLSGQFGVHYQLNKLSIGFSLPKLFDSSPSADKTFSDIEFNQYRNKFGSVAYAFDLGPNVQLSPIVIFRAQDKQQDQWEGMLMANYKNILWIGSSYRVDYGVTGFIGINLKGLLRIGYAYEQPTGDIGKISGGSHEVYLGARLSQRNREDLIAERTQRIDSLKNDNIAQENDIEQEPETDQPVEDEATVEPVETFPIVVQQDPSNEDQQLPTRETEDIKQQTPVVQPEIATAEEEQKPTNTIQPTAPQADERTADDGYYLVVGVFKSVDNAIKQMSYLKKDGFSPAVLYRSDKDFYYVYTTYSPTRQETIDEWKKIRRQNKYYGSWIYLVDDVAD